MSRLFIYFSHSSIVQFGMNNNLAGLQIAQFNESTDESLGLAIKHIQQEAITRAQALAEGTVEGAPQMFVDNAIEFLANPKLQRMLVKVQQIDNGFLIFADEGPDCYALIE